MSNQMRKLSHQILALVLIAVFAVGMIPLSVLAEEKSTVETDLGDQTIYVGEYVEFKVGTTPNDHEGRYVLGYLDFNGGDWSVLDSLQYQESKNGQWYDLPQGVPFGPPEKGFPMLNVESTFQVKFKQAGTYSFSITMKDVQTGEELCSTTERVTVTVKPSELTTNIGEQQFVVGTPCEFTFTSIPNGHLDRWVFGKFTFSDWDAVETLKYWGVNEQEWLPLPKDTLFGPPDKGFQMKEATTRLKVTFNKAGTYSCTVQLVDKDNTDNALCSVTKDVVVTETIPPVVDSVSGNPENWAQSATVTGTVSDDGGSGIAKVVYGTTAEYNEQLPAAALKDGAFTFEVTENATYYVWAIDGNGNVSQDAKSVVIDKIDTTPPNLDVNANPEAWTNGQVTITGTATDDNGVTVKHGKTDSIEQAEEVALDGDAVTITIDYEHNDKYYVWAIDEAGNSVQAVVTIQIDKTSPLVTITTVPSTVYTNEDVTVQGTVTDEASEVQKVVYGTEAVYNEQLPEAVLNDGNFAFSVSENGTYYVWAVDKAGNFSEIANITITNIDKTNPVVNSAIVPGAWTNQDVIVSIEASDEGGATIHKVVYSETDEYTEDLPEAELGEDGKYTFTVSKDGFSDLYYVWVVDKAGNVSEKAVVDPKMDVTAPTVDSSSVDHAEWTNTSVTVSGSVSDKGGAGVEKVVYSTENVYVDNLPTATLDQDGQYSFTVNNTESFNGTYYIWAVDAAGNHTETAAEAVVSIDVIAPTVDTITADKDEATNETVTITGKVSDEGGSNVVQVVYNTTGVFGEGLQDAAFNKADQTYTIDVDNIVDFKGTYYVWAIDKAGNRTAEPAEKNVHIDVTTAAATISVSKGSWDKFLEAITFGLYYSDTFSVTIEATDSTATDSGIRSVEYIISDVALSLEEVKQVTEWNPYTVAFDISEEQKLIVYARVVDEVGNVAFYSTDGIILDKTPATITLTPSALAADNGNKDVHGYYNGDATIDIAVDDALSGIHSIGYWITVDGDEIHREALYSFGYDGSYAKDKEWMISGSDVAEENKTYVGIPTEDMLKKNWKGQITVPAADYNSCNVVVTVEVTDNAGKSAEESVMLDIDKTRPTVQIEYNNHAGLQHNGKYYHDNRTATIVVTERGHHFVAPTLYVNESVPEGATNYIHITAVDVKGNNVEYAPTIEWIPTEDPEDPDKTVHTAKIFYDVDANYTFDIKVQDAATNVNEGVTVNDADAPYEFTVDKTNPEGTLKIEEYSVWETIVKTLTFGLYTKESFDVTATAADATSPIKVEYYKATAQEALTILDVESIKNWTEVTLSDTEPLLTVGASEQFVVYLKVTDYADRIHYASTDGAIVDQIAPDVYLKPDEANGNGIYNKDVNVAIDVNEPTPYSGIHSIEYQITADGVVTKEGTLYSFGYDGSYAADKEWSIVGSDVDAENGSYTGVPTHDMLKQSWKGQITVPAADNNSSNVVVTVKVTDNAGKEKTVTENLDIDITQPTIDVSYDNNTARNDKYFNANREATVVITERSNHFIAPALYANEAVPEDAVNYIHITAVDARGQVVAIDPAAIISDWETVEGATPDAATHTAKIAYTADANYTFAIAYTDMADNANTPIVTGDSVAPYEFAVDKVDPFGTVTGASKEGRTTTWDALVSKLTFGFWSGSKITITETHDDLTSPVESVKYYKTDETKALKETDLDKITKWSSFKKITATPNQQFTVYLKITDYAGNYSYISTDGLIVDNTAPREESIAPEITVKPQQPINGLYNGDVKVNIVVTDPLSGDTFAGLKKVSYRVLNLGEETQNEVLYTFDIENPTKKDLYQTWTGDITVQSALNNSNDVVIEVYAEDNAGNTSSDKVAIKIDTTAPQIDVDYNNDKPDSGRYYKADRVATIKITERNFDPKDVQVFITNTDEVIPAVPVEIADWTEAKGKAANGDGTTYTATITYAADGDYTFAIEYTDLAGWTCGNVAGQKYDNKVAFAKGTKNPTEFTIDQTAPIVEVEYSNNAAQNDKYFDAGRVATITVTEHNFPLDDMARVVFTQAVDRGGVIPAIDWDHEGDTHIATITYAADGDYIFDVTMTDLAGNASGEANYGASVAGKDFVIDTTFNEMISQSGIKNGVAYGHDDTVIPSIQISDINLQDYEVTLRGVQKDKTIDLTEEVNALLKKGNETVTGVFDIFETKQDLDGIYTLKMISKDKAGNEDSMEIVFTVNRFGSVYVYDQYLMGLIANGGSYVYSVNGDLVITEYNADQLLSGSLKIEITVDGKPLENAEYTVTPEINNEVEVGDSGWYEYKYTISKDNFKTDGVYKISVSSEDATGNTPENSNYEDMGMSFRVDSTPAEITSIVGLEEAIYNQTEITVKYTVYDTIGLKSVKVYVNDELVDEVTDFSADMNNYDGQFPVKELPTAQSVRIVVQDMSGNITDTGAENFSSAYVFNGSVTVSTNFLVRWYADPVLFWGSIAGVVILAGGIIFLVAAKRKKQEEKSAEK